jgi:hypothetical protein
LDNHVPPFLQEADDAESHVCDRIGKATLVVEEQQNWGKQ